jgi:hypothetical protein
VEEEVEKRNKETQTLTVNSMEKPLMVKSAVFTSVAKANIIHIPVLHEMSPPSQPSSSPASDSSGCTAAASALNAAAAAASGASSSGSVDASGFHGDADIRTGTGTGTGRDVKVHCTQQLYRTTEELNPVSAVSHSPVGQPRSRFVAWSSSTDHRTLRSGRTASVDRYGPTNTSFPESCFNEFVSNQSMSTEASTGRQVILLGRSGNRTPSVEPPWSSNPSPVYREDGSDVDASRGHHGDDRKSDFAMSGFVEGKVICVAPGSQMQQSASSSSSTTSSISSLCSANMPSSGGHVSMTSLTITTAPGTRIRISRCRRTSDPQISKT